MFLAVPHYLVLVPICLFYFFVAFELCALFTFLSFPSSNTGLQLVATLPVVQSPLPDRQIRPEPRAMARRTVEECVCVPNDSVGCRPSCDLVSIPRPQHRCWIVSHQQKELLAGPRHRFYTFFCIFF